MISGSKVEIQNGKFGCFSNEKIAEPVTTLDSDLLVILYMIFSVWSTLSIEEVTHIKYEVIS